MTSHAPHDVWIIQALADLPTQIQVCLYHNKEGQWQQQLSMDWQQFNASAQAFSSLCLADTQVYLNLPALPDDFLSSDRAHRTWVAHQPHPHRLLCCKHHAWHQTLLSDVKTMGQNAQVICTQNLQRFEQASRLFTVNSHELDTLGKWTRGLESEHIGMYNKIQLWLRLYLLAGDSHQRTRFALLTCMAGALLIVQGVNQRELDTQLALSKQSVTQQLQTQTKGDKQPDWSTLQAQLEKFGEGKRANVTSVQMLWNEAGSIGAQVQLARERKRVPKGCQLLAPQLAQCKPIASSAGNKP